MKPFTGTVRSGGGRTQILAAAEPSPARAAQRPRLPHEGKTRLPRLASRPRKPSIWFEVARRVALSLPGVQERATAGGPVLLRQAEAWPLVRIAEFDFAANLQDWRLCHPSRRYGRLPATCLGDNIAGHPEASHRRRFSEDSGTGQAIRLSF